MTGDTVKVRLVSLTVQPMIVLDDGENLTPRPVTHMSIESSRIDEVPTQIRAALKDLQQQIDVEFGE
jgi:hypothetical protein